VRVSSWNGIYAMKCEKWRGSERRCEMEAGYNWNV
jgi:hypothetical protein